MPGNCPRESLAPRREGPPFRLGLGLHERPIIFRLNSTAEPIEVQAGMVFALETYCPAGDGFTAARIEEEVIVTENGPRVLTLFLAEELFVANPY